MLWQVKWVARTVKVVIALAHADVVKHYFFQNDYALEPYFFIPYFNELRAIVPLHGTQCPCAQASVQSYRATDLNDRRREASGPISLTPLAGPTSPHL
jgi:hypothetical protein